MKYKAKVSFAGKLSMAKGQVKEISNKELISDLLKAKYIEEVKEPTKEVKEPTKEGSEVKKAKAKK